MALLRLSAINNALVSNLDSLSRSFLSVLAEAAVMSVFASQNRRSNHPASYAGVVINFEDKRMLSQEMAAAKGRYEDAPPDEKQERAGGRKALLIALNAIVTVRPFAAAIIETNQCSTNLNVGELPESL